MFEFTKGTFDFTVDRGRARDHEARRAITRTRDDEERTKNKGKVERRSEIERKTGRRGEGKRRRRGVSPRVLSRVQGVTSYFPRRYFCLRSVTRGSSEWCPGHLEMPASFLVYLSVYSSVPGRPVTDCVLDAIPDRGMRPLDLA